MKKFLPLLILLLLWPSVARSELKVISNAEVFQGRSFIVFIASSETYKQASLYFDNKKMAFFPYEKGLRAIVGCEPEKQIGDYPLRIEAATKDNRLEILNTSITVSTRLFPKVSFWLKPAKKKLLTPDLVQKEWSEIEKVILVETPQKFWWGNFGKPVSGIITMAFGTREYVNGKVSGRHRGCDFRAKIGTTVRAPHNGEVIFAKHLKAFGGTLVIDHGQGIQTLYFHLSKILLPVGAWVKRGEVIARTGNSGISSGPHLHWGFSVHNVRVDPLQWVETVMP
jgi:murein DD-endopeptidase MepM/ murein hydrolase activator NlpD